MWLIVARPIGFVFFRFHLSSVCLFIFLFFCFCLFFSFSVYSFKLIMNNVYIYLIDLICVNRIQKYQFHSNACELWITNDVNVHTISMNLPTYSISGKWGKKCSFKSGLRSKISNKLLAISVSIRVIYYELHARTWPKLKFQHL